MLGSVMGTVRTGVGAAMMVAPGWAARIWVGDDADGHGAKVLARALGARDVALCRRAMFWDDSTDRGPIEIPSFRHGIGDHPSRWPAWAPKEVAALL